MKKIKYLVILAAMAVSFNACVVRAHTGVWVRGHYSYGPNGGRVWVPGHYAG